MTPTLVFLPLGHPAASFVSIATSNENYILFHLFLMITSPVQFKETLDSKKETHFIYIAQFMHLDLDMGSKDTHKKISCPGFMLQTFSSLQLIHISWQQMHLLTVLYVLPLQVCSAVKLEWKPPVSLTFPLRNGALCAHFSTWLPRVVKDYLVCLLNY